jgi:hypothetical protein
VQWEDLAGSYPSNKAVCNGIQTDRNCSASPDATQRSADGGCVFTDADLNHAVAVVGWGEDAAGCPDQGIPGPIKYAVAQRPFHSTPRCHSLLRTAPLSGLRTTLSLRCDIVCDSEYPRRYYSEYPRRYWIIQNSHGAGTGDCEGVGCGFYKFERGRNAFGLETSGVHATSIDLSNMACKDKTDPATWCANGGSFTPDCGCYCPPEYGFTGETCRTCDVACEGGASPVVQPADAMRGVPATCKCACPKGQWSPTNLAGKGIDDCAIAVGLWASNKAITPDALQWDSPVHVETAPATFDWLFSKQKEKPNAGYAPYINKGDFLVAVPTGSKPWTPETNWDGNAGKANICGPKEVKDNQLVNCANVYGGWGNMGDSDKGTLTISKEGVFDVYFVKYQGVSEFGVDKGFGKNFAKLPQTLVVGAMPGGRRAEVNSAIQAMKVRNRQQQLRKQLAANSKKRAEVQVQQARVDAAAAKADADREARDVPRSAFLPLVINGLPLSEFSMVEETSLKSLLAQYAGAVCTPDPKGPSSKYKQCDVRDAWVQRFRTNVTTQLPEGLGIVVYAKVTTNESAIVPLAAANIAAAIQSGRFTTSLKTSGGAFTRRAAALNIALYTASVLQPQPLVPVLPPTTLPAASAAGNGKITYAPTAMPTSFGAASGSELGLCTMAEVMSVSSAASAAGPQGVLARISELTKSNPPCGACLSRCLEEQSEEQGACATGCVGSPAAVPPAGAPKGSGPPAGLPFPVDR